MVRDQGRRCAFSLCIVFQALYSLAQPEFVPYRPSTGLSRLQRTAELDNSTIQKIERLSQVFKSQVRKLRDLNQVDLVFLLDSSASVGVRNFYTEVNFVKKFLSDFTVSYNSSRVSVISYSSQDKVKLQIDHIRNKSVENHKCSLLDDQLPHVEYSGGGTYTLGAFLKAEDTLRYSRPSSHKVIFLITDGFSNGGDPVPVADRLKENQAEIFTLGIANGDPVELKKLASEPKEDHSFVLKSFKEFEALTKRSLREELRPGGVEVVPKEQCDRLCPYHDDCCDRHATCYCGTRIGYYSCACDPGYYGSGHRGTCEICPPNTYRSDVSTDRCSACPDSNQSSPRGSTSIEQCTCRPGFTLSRNRRCIQIRCTILVPPEFGYLVDSSCSDATLNAACAVRCQLGYYIIGNSIRVCQKDSTWSGVQPKCEPKKCRKLPIPKHGILRCSSQSLTYGTKCRIVCKEAYTLVGSQRRRCMALGIWDGMPARCHRVLPLESITQLEPLTDVTVRPTFKVWSDLLVRISQRIHYVRRRQQNMNMVRS